MSEPTEIDLGPFLMAVIEEMGGEVRIPYNAFRKQVAPRAIAFDIEDDGATIVMSVVEEIPVED
jgi:hypothetical protein